MGILEFVASQLRKPSGLIGKFVVARILNTGNVPMNQLTLASLDLKPDDRVIEIGFGGGDLMNRMASVVTNGHIAGVDFSPEMVELCTKRFAPLIQSQRIELHCASAERLPLDSDRFTKACTVNTIYFWPDPVGPLSEFTTRPRAEWSARRLFQSPGNSGEGALHEVWLQLLRTGTGSTAAGEGRV